MIPATLRAGILQSCFRILLPPVVAGALVNGDGAEGDIYLAAHGGLAKVAEHLPRFIKEV